VGTLVVDAGVQGPAVTGAEDVAQKFAMLSVYYASIGDQFDVSGAPSAFVPPEVSPQPLADALEVLATNPARLEQAIWQIVRNTPIRQAGQRTSRYPPEITDYLSLGDQAVLDERRAEYRMGASLVAACLRACHHDDKDLYAALIKAAAVEAVTGNDGFRRVVELLYDQSPEAFLSHLEEVSADDQRWRDERVLIDAIEKEVSVGIATYVERLAATAAYESFLHDPGRLGSKAGHDAMSIYPVHSIISQSTRQLWTSATVTTLAHGELDGLLAATQPDRWHEGSDVIETSHYVANPYSRKSVTVEIAEDHSIDGLLYEVATMAWGQDPAQQATFRNVLNVQRTVDPDPRPQRPAIDLQFSLCRSISSDVLWDTRNGGITLNEGFLKVVALGNDCWRVTSRKLLRFSDRTPYSGANGWTDFGQMLNYLAPAALSWWVDTETYSLGMRTAAAAQSVTTPKPRDNDEDGHDE
jgi:hypothetical protein